MYIHIINIYIYTMHYDVIQRTDRISTILFHVFCSTFFATPLLNQKLQALQQLLSSTPGPPAQSSRLAEVLSVLPGAPQLKNDGSTIKEWDSRRSFLLVFFEKHMSVMFSG